MKKLNINATLWFIHGVVGVVVIGAALIFWHNADFATKCGFVLAVLGILLSSASALVKSDSGNKICVGICLAASAFSAFLFIAGLDDQQKNGPRLGTVSIKIVAAGYDVELMNISGQPCTLAEKNASTYVCNVTVTPRAHTPAAKP